MKNISIAHDTENKRTRALVLCPILPALITKTSGQLRSEAAILEEAVALALAINLHVMWSGIVHVNKITPSTLIGKGMVENLAAKVKEHGAELVIMNCALSPVQQRNLEKTCNVKVIDRTGLILEIFGERAHTREGQLQVELAALTYQRSRLVRSWTHLERQRGGFGFLGGPGESQIEIDRRLIDERIVKLKRNIEDVRRTRAIQRKARQTVPFPVVALVGYTNAGKSTLFNALTKAKVFADPQLFATLDPTMRAVELEGGWRVILSDTVGFISDLPTQLVAAFRATLEEIEAADIILHVRDISHPDTEAQCSDVNSVLHEMGIEPETDERIIEVLNKIDLLAPEDVQRISARQVRHAGTVPISALTGKGLDDLKLAICKVLDKRRVTVRLRLPVTEGAALAWLYEKSKISERRDTDEAIFLSVLIDKVDLERFLKKYGKASIDDYS